MSNPTEIPFGQGGARVPSSLVQKGLQFANNIGLDALTALIQNIVEQQMPAPYVLPTASAETLGGVKVGDGLQISEQGVLSSSGGNSPLIIEGTADPAESGWFIPNEGQASHEDAVEAFCNGTVVLLDIVDENVATHTLYSVTSFDFDSSELTAGNFTW